MAAPVRQATGAGQTSTGAALSVPWPAHNPDDVGLLIVESTGTATPMTAPTGWTAVVGTPLVDVASVAGSTFYVFWRRAITGGEPDAVTGAQADHQDAMIVTYRGCITSGSPIDVSAVATKAVASLTATMPTVTTLTANCLCVLIASRPNDSAAVNHFGALTNAALTGLAEDIEYGTIDGDGGGFGVAHGTKAVAGVVGTTTYAKGSSTTDCTLTIALKEAPAGTAPIYRPPIVRQPRRLLRLSKRRGPVTPLTQVAATVTVTYTPPIVARRRPARPLLRRPQQPSTPPTAIVTVVATFVPPIAPARRLRGPRITRGKITPAPPAPQIAVVVAFVPPIGLPRRRLGWVRRRQQPTVTPSVVVVVPRIARPARRILRPVRRRQPVVQVVAVRATFVPPIARPRRRVWISRRGGRMASTTASVATILNPGIAIMSMTSADAELTFSTSGSLTVTVWAN